MDKKITGHGMQLAALLLFVVFALACASQQTVVDDSGKGNDAGTNDGASIKHPVDTIENTIYYTLK